MQDYRLRAKTPAIVPGRLTLPRTCVRSYYTTDYEPELLPLRRGRRSQGPAPDLPATAFMRDLLAYGLIIRVVDRIPGAPFAATTAIPHDRIPQLPTIRHPQDVVRKPENGMLGGVGTVPFLYWCYSTALLPRSDSDSSFGGSLTKIWLRTEVSYILPLWIHQEAKPCTWVEIQCHFTLVSE